MGYAGGTKVNPSYYNLGDHTETIDVDYDPNVTNFEKMLDMFWKNHDPTSRCTRQYMSAIFYRDEEQKRLAEESMARENKNRNGKISTKVLPLGEFYVAEDYHQKYLLQQHPWLLTALDVDPGEDLIESHVACRLNGYLGGYGTFSKFDQEWEKLGLNEKMSDYVRNQMKKRAH